MQEIMTLIILAFAVSLDSFTVGFTYGMRKMGLPFKAILVIACISATTFFISMMIGKAISWFISPHITEILGGVILISIGAWVIYQFFKSDNHGPTEPKDPYILKLEIQSLGIVIQILRKPMTADIDKSGTINGIEALLLGLALSLDAFGAGVGAAMFGFEPLLTAGVIAFMSSSFLWVGLKSGFFLSCWGWLHRLSFLPGVLLILIGVMKMT